MMKKGYYLLIALCLHSGLLSAQIFGSTSVCPGNYTYSYSVSLLSNCNNNGTGGPLNARWSISGGVFIDPNTGDEVNNMFDVGGVIVKWGGSPASTGSLNVDYVFGPGPFPCGESLFATYIYPDGARPNDPNPVVPDTGAVCSGTSSPITLTSSFPESGAENVWGYRLNGGGDQLLAINTTNSIQFAVPGSAQPGDSFVFFVYERFASCQNTLSNVTAVSAPVTILAGAPNFNPVPTDRICTTSGGVTITGISTTASDVFIRIRDSGGLVVVASGPYPASSSPSFSLAPGSYQAQVENYSAGCFTIKGFTVGSSNPLVNVGISGFTNATCHGASTGSIDITPSGGSGAGGFTYAWSNAAASQDISSLPGGATYSVTVTDANGCTGATSQFIADPADLVLGALQVSNYGGPGVTCVGASDGQISFSTATTGGTPAYNYTWRNAATTVVGTAATLTGVPAGVYAVTVTDANLCQKTGGNTPITSPVPLVAGTTTGTDPACFGTNGSITIAGASGGTGALSWSIDGLTQSPTASSPITFPFNALADTYTATVTDANSCAVVVSPNVVLTNPPAIGVSNAIIDPTCFGFNDGKITVTASSGFAPYDFSSDGGASFQGVNNNVFNSGITAGTYSVVVKDSHGCLSPIATAIVGQPTQVGGSIAPPPPFSCFSTANSASLDLTPSGGTAPYTFLWNTSAISEDISVVLGSSLSTNYSVTITDSKNCANSRNFLLTQPALLTNTIAPTNISCFGVANGAMDLSPAGGTTPYSFLWNNAATSEDISSLPAGNYSVDITDANGCTSPGATVVTEPPLLTLSQGTTTNILCFGQSNGTVVLNAGGGTGAYEYSKDGLSWQSPSPLITGLPLNASTLHVRDQNLCSTQILVNITQPPILAVSVSNIVDASCGLSNGSALAAGSGGTGSYTFEWRDISNNVVSAAAPVNGIPGGVFRVVISDQNACTDFHDTPIASPNGPQIAINSLTPTQCSYSNDGGASISVSSGQAPYNISWNNGEAGNNPVALKPGANVNFVTVTDAIGCVAAKAVNVSSPAALSITVSSTALPTCPGGTDGSIQTSASGGIGAFSFHWNTGGATNTLSNIPAGNYQLTVQDSHSCSTSRSLPLADKVPISIQSPILSSPSCNGGSDGAITVVASGANGSFTYAWNSGAATAAVTSLPAGTFIVTAKDGSGCTAQKTVVLTDPPPLKIDLGPDRKICQGGSFRISSPVSSPTYLWSSSNGFSSSASTVTLTQSGTYSLLVTNSNGCKATDSFDLLTVTDLLKADFLVIPEAFEGDTLILIDISWPLPESISWRFPQPASVVSQNSDFAEIIIPTAGSYTITMDAALASCQSSHSENITILAGARPKTGGRSATEPLIQSAKLYPNPNMGEFRVDVELHTPAPIEMTIVNLAANKTLASFTSSGADHYVWPLHLTSLEQGVYFLIIKAGNQSKSIQFVKM